MSIDGELNYEINITHSFDMDSVFTLCHTMLNRCDRVNRDDSSDESTFCIQRVVDYVNHGESMNVGF